MSKKEEASKIEKLRQYILELEYDLAVYKRKAEFQLNDSVYISYMARLAAKSGRSLSDTAPKKPKGYREPGKRDRSELFD